MWFVESIFGLVHYCNSQCWADSSFESSFCLFFTFFSFSFKPISIINCFNLNFYLFGVKERQWWIITGAMIFSISTKICTKIFSICTPLHSKNLKTNTEMINKVVKKPLWCGFPYFLMTIIIFQVATEAKYFMKTRLTRLS